MIRSIIIEDNELDQLVASKLIDQHDGITNVGTFSNAIEAISCLDSLNPDLIFLDVELPGMDGFEFLKCVKKVPQIILVTAHENYAIDAFENEVTDFILKPFTKERFNKAIDKASKMHSWLSIANITEDSIYIRAERSDVKLFLKEILYIEAKGDYVRVVTIDNKYMVLTTMKSIESLLPEDQFIRVHRAHLINLKHISLFSGNDLTIGEKVLTVSRNGKRKLNELLS